MAKFLQSVLQPKPLPLKRPFTSLPEDFADQPSSCPVPKRYRPESVDRFVTQWVESTSESEPYRERHCRSDSLLGHPDGDHLSRRLTKSAPNMELTQNDMGMHPTRLSSRRRPLSYCLSANPSDAVGSAGRSSTDVTGRSSKPKLIEDPNYRDENLATNNIYMRSRRDQFPEHISSLVDHVRRDRNSPGPSVDYVEQDEDLEGLTGGVPESQVQRYFQDEIFHRPTGSLKHAEKLPMVKRAVPYAGYDGKRVVTPAPDILYGYGRLQAFPQQATQFRSMANEMVANTARLLYPFFIVEFEGDGSSGGANLWVATNQCLGGSASCVNIAEGLNDRLRQCKSSEILPINSAAFSIAMSGTEARLYITWKHDELNYYMQDVESFLLQRPNDYLEFRKYVRNIMDWGKGTRLTDIRDSLDTLLEESRRASEMAKSRPPPPNDFPSSKRSQPQMESS